MITTYVSVLVAVIVLTGLTYYFLKSQAGNGKRKYNAGVAKDNTTQAGGLNTTLVQGKWLEIVAMQSHGPSGLKNALIEADKLLDYVMIQKGFTGETMGDRLKSGGSAFSNLNNIWSAHKLRNQLAHEVEIDVVAEQVKHAINNLGQGIKDLGVNL
jgi:hypothetical protein